MTIYDLSRDITIQGNIQIVVYDSTGEEIETFYFRDELSFDTICCDIDGHEDAEVTYIYHDDNWLVIECVEDFENA